MVQHHERTKYLSGSVNHHPRLGLLRFSSFAIQLSLARFFLVSRSNFDCPSPTSFPFILDYLVGLCAHIPSVRHSACAINWNINNNLSISSKYHPFFIEGETAKSEIVGRAVSWVHCTNVWFTINARVKGVCQ